MIAGCGDNSFDSRVNSISMEKLSDLRESAYFLDEGKIRDNIESLYKKDGDRTLACRWLYDYYLKEKGHFVWIDKYGVDCCADTLLTYISLSLIHI